MKFPICLLFILLTLQVKAQPYKDFTQWNDICFCSMNNGYHPNAIVEADNNWDILQAMRKGKSLQELDSLNIPYNKSQLLLLQSQKLIESNKGIYKTAIPIIDSVQTLNLRIDSRNAAKILYPTIEKECKNLVNYLNKEGLSNNSFSILFSYVLDGMIWDKMETNQMIDKRDGQNIWSGHYWVLETKRPFSCGTNSFGIGGENTIHFNWVSPLLQSNLTVGLFKTQYLIPLLQYLDEGKVISDTTVLKKWKDWHVLSSEGKLTIPIIDENDTNGIPYLSNTIIDILLAEFQTKIDIDSIKNKYNFSDNKETIVIFYHEIMWDLMDLLIEKQVIIKPTILDYVNPQNESEIQQIIFIKKKNNKL